MRKTISAIKVRKNLGQVLNEVALKSDEYVVERAGKPLVAIIPIESYLTMKRDQSEFFKGYDSLQARATGDADTVDADIAEAIRAARR